MERVDQKLFGPFQLSFSPSIAHTTASHHTHIRTYIHIVLSYSPILSLVKLSIVKVSLKISLTANCLLLCLGVSECIFAFWPLFLDFFFAIVQSTLSVTVLGFGSVFSGLEFHDNVY